MELIPWLRLQWDRVLGVGLMLAGAVVLIVGWAGASGEVYIANQLPYLMSGGLGGLALLGVGATLWLSADLSDEWRTLDRLEAADVASPEAPALADRVRELETRVAALTAERDSSAAQPEFDRVRT